jgi:hypothetical protein
MANALLGKNQMNMSGARLRWLYLHGAFWWGGLGCAIFGLVLILLGLLLWRGEQRFQEHVLRATAKVTSKEKGRETRDSSKGKVSVMVYYLFYVFPDSAGRQHEGKMSVSDDAWKQAKAGDELAIEYDSTDPGTSRRAGTDIHAGWGLLLLGGIGGLFASIGIPFAAVALVQSVRRAHIVQHGTPTIGIVTEVAENNAALKVAGTYRLLYRFTVENGETVEGRGPPQPWSLAARWNPGETILVLYNPHNPRRNEADVWEARNEDLAKLQEPDDAG